MLSARPAERVAGLGLRRHMNASHEDYLQALRSRSYEGLFIRRTESCCYLIIRLEGEDRTFVNQFGKSPEYRHAWQIRKWLREHFGIEPESVPVKGRNE